MTIDERIKLVRMLVLDVDGVLTDGGLTLGSNGHEAKTFNVQDGMGVTLARMGGLKVGIITGRTSEAVTRRAKELHMDALYQGHFNKMEAWRDLKMKYDLDDEHIAYMGDDLLDIPIMKQAGLVLAPANAREEVQKIAHIVTKTSGGRGAVREAVETILKKQDKWKDLLKQIETENS